MGKEAVDTADEPAEQRVGCAPDAKYRGDAAQHVQVRGRLVVQVAEPDLPGAVAQHRRQGEQGPGPYRARRQRFFGRQRPVGGPHPQQALPDAQRLLAGDGDRPGGLARVPRDAVDAAQVFQHGAAVGLEAQTRVVRRAVRVVQDQVIVQRAADAKGLAVHRHPGQHRTIAVHMFDKPGHCSRSRNMRPRRWALSNEKPRRSMWLLSRSRASSTWVACTL